MNLTELLDVELLEQRISEGYVNRRLHNEHPLAILNYSAQTQYEWVWDEITTKCRGLIYNVDSLDLVARSFDKFFNYTEVSPPMYAWSIPPLVYDKLDGSLGIIHPTPDGYAVATRGSFHSEQAEWATAWLRENMPDFSQPEGVTTLCEILYSDNRIVVNYGDREELVLLAAIEHGSGRDVPLWEIDWWDGSTAEQYVGWGDVDSIHHKATALTEGEGVVMVWHRPDEPSFRFKCKAEQYKRLHKIVCNLSNRSVWEALKNDTFHELLESVPDEFHAWISEVKEGLESACDDIWRQVGEDLMATYADVGLNADRKTMALRIKKTTYPGLCFSVIDNKDISGKVWDMIKPERESPLISEEE